MRSIYPLIIVLAAGCAFGRLMSTQRVYEPSMRWPSVQPKPMPTFSSNDRSRWATVRALVDEGTWVIGRRDPRIVTASALAPFGQNNALGIAALAQAGYVARTSDQANTGIIFEDGYQSVDKVLRPETLDFYSSKPPLLTAIIAALYWLLQLLTGWTLAEHPNAVVRTILVLVSILPFMLYLWMLAQLLERWGRTLWGKTLVLLAAGFATLVSPFLITLTNHTLGTFFVMGAIYAAVRIHEKMVSNRNGGRGPSSGWLFLSGLLAGLATCMELPALALLAALGGLYFLWAPLRTQIFYLGGAALPICAFFVANWLAIGQLEPAYSEFGGPWYEYEGSHWRPPPPGEIKYGIDWARFHESRWEYALHVLIGHHGFFSLTPLWLLALFGILGGTRRWLRHGRHDAFDRTVSHEGEREPHAMAWFVPPVTLAVSAAVIGFYLYKSDNYGGFTLGLRWLMWLTPLWLLCLLPVVDRLSDSRLGRWIAYACLAVSGMSANYSPWNPWRQPWLYDLMLALGWPGYGP